MKCYLCPEAVPRVGIGPHVLSYARALLHLGLSRSAPIVTTLISQPTTLSSSHDLLPVQPRVPPNTITPAGALRRTDLGMSLLIQAPFGASALMEVMWPIANQDFARLR